MWNVIIVISRSVSLSLFLSHSLSYSLIPNSMSFLSHFTLLCSILIFNPLLSQSSSHMPDLSGALLSFSLFFTLFSLLPFYHSFFFFFFASTLFVSSCFLSLSLSLSLSLPLLFTYLTFLYDISYQIPLYLFVPVF